MSDTQVFVVSAEHRSDPQAKLTQFLITASYHRDAWRVAREVCRTGKGAEVRDPVTQKLEPFPVPAGQLTVKRVLSTSSVRRGRPPKLNSQDLLSFAEDRGVHLSKKLRGVIDELMI